MLDKKEVLYWLIYEEQGIKSLELLTEFSTKLRELNTKLTDLDEYEDLLEQLVTENKITVIDYVLDKYPDKLKSYILPKCIKVEVHNDIASNDEYVVEMIDNFREDYLSQQADMWFKN